MEGRRVFEDLTVEENLIASTYALTGATATNADFDLVYEYFPAPARAAQGPGRLPLGRRAADAGHWPRAHRPAPADPAGRALAGPGGPKLTEDIFGIIARINAERGTSMLLVEQNATVALAVAHSGYIMENGKIVIDGSGRAPGGRPDVREFYLGMGGGGGGAKASKTSSTTSAAKAGCHEDG